MPNMSPKKNPMPSQAPQVRSALPLRRWPSGYTEEHGHRRGQLRCLACKHKPCVAGCPVAIHIPQFIAKIKEG